LRQPRRAVGRLSIAEELLKMLDPLLSL
jgi:hypothetical protein